MTPTLVKEKKNIKLDVIKALKIPKHLRYAIEDYCNAAIKIKEYNLKRIILFGSCARQTATVNSDIDMCLIVDYNEEDNQIKDKIEYLYTYTIVQEANEFIPQDTLVRTQKQYDKSKHNEASVIHYIEEDGVILYES